MHKDVQGDDMAHLTFKEWLDKYECELWVDYWKEFEDEEWINREDFFEWCEEKWKQDGIFGGGS